MGFKVDSHAEVMAFGYYFDKNGDGEVNFDEFRAGFLKIIKPY